MTKKSTHKSKLNAKDMSINIDVSADCIGEVVLSLRGRDSKRRFVIIGAAAEVGYVYVADGRLRKVESPKKKKRKHLLTEGWQLLRLLMLSVVAQSQTKNCGSLYAAAPMTQTAKFLLTRNRCSEMIFDEY